MTNLASMLTETAAAHGERPSLKLDDLQVPYAAVEQATPEDLREVPAEHRRA